MLTSYQMGYLAATRPDLLQKLAALDPEALRIMQDQGPVSPEQIAAAEAMETAKPQPADLTQASNMTEAEQAEAAKRFAQHEARTIGNNAYQKLKTQGTGPAGAPTKAPEVVKPSVYGRATGWVGEQTKDLPLLARIKDPKIRGLVAALVGVGGAGALGYGAYRMLSSDEPRRRAE